MIDFQSLATIAGAALVVAAVVYFAAGLDWSALVDVVPSVPDDKAAAIADPVDLMIVAHRACVAANLQESAGNVAAGIAAALRAQGVPSES